MLQEPPITKEELVSNPTRTPDFTPKVENLSRDDKKSSIVVIVEATEACCNLLKTSSRSPRKSERLLCSEDWVNLKSFNSAVMDPLKKHTYLWTSVQTPFCS